MIILLLSGHGAVYGFVPFSGHPLVYDYCAGHGAVCDYCADFWSQSFV
jgi:hypothetical protein